MKYGYFDLDESTKLVSDLAGEFWSEAIDTRQTLQRQRELDAFRRRTALRLVPVPKMGFEHLHLMGCEDDFDHP